MAEFTKDRSSELSALSKQQFAALEKATFLGMTIEETVEYDNRHARIGEICRKIDKFKATNKSPGFFRSALSGAPLYQHRVSTSALQASSMPETPIAIYFAY